MLEKNICFRFLGTHFHRTLLPQLVCYPRTLITLWTLGIYQKDITRSVDLAIAFFNLTFCMGTGLLEGCGWKETTERIDEKFWLVILAKWRVWSFVHLFTFTMIPLQFRVIMLTILWMIYFSKH
eukprot:jgi/Galph1/5210/GphlegSOOS_G3898.1